MDGDIFLLISVRHPPPQLMPSCRCQDIPQNSWLKNLSVELSFLDGSFHLNTHNNCHNSNSNSELIKHCSQFNSVQFRHWKLWKPIL